MIITQNICDACGYIVEHEDAVEGEASQEGGVSRVAYVLDDIRIRADVCNDCNTKIMIEINKAVAEIRKMLVES